MTTQPEPIGPVGPLLDDDSFEAIDDAIHELAQRRSVWLDDAGLIHILASLINHAEACLPDIVTGARDDGTSWEDIARLLGTSPGHAEAKYDPASPMADTRNPHLY